MRTGIWLVSAVALVIVACSSGSADRVAPSAGLLTSEPTPTPTTQLPAASPAQTAIPTELPELTLLPTATAEMVPTPAATHVPEPIAIVCETRPSVPAVINDRPVISGVTGESVLLDTGLFFGASSDFTGLQWTQLFAAQTSLDYTSYNLVDLTQDGETATFVAQFPGNYRFGLVDSGGSSGDGPREVEVSISAENKREFAVRGIVYPDLFRDNGGPGFNINPEADVCRDDVIAHALSIAQRIGNNWIAITPANFLTQLSPTPVWGAQYSDLSLLDDEFFAALIDAAHDRGLKVLQHEQDAPDFTIQHDFEQWNVARQTPEYWDAWFTRWQPWVVERAARAERLGVDMYSPYVWADDTFLPDIYPEYADRWREMIGAIREVYSGKVALAIMFFRPDLLTFADDLDAVILNFDGTAFPGRLEDPGEPSVTEIIAAAAGEFGRAREFLSDSSASVYFQISSMSADMQLGTEDLALRATFDADYQEQVIYYEALFQLAASESWVEGVWVSTVNWFDQNAREPEFYYFDETLLGNPRSKPAEDVMALWFTGGVD